MSGAPARGTAPRRPRRHHHHHHHHHHNNNNIINNNNNNEDPSSDEIHEKVTESSRPKVNPIFLWALQREQRIVEVRCEDYDKRNRIKLTKTAQGWRSIPRTASNVYTKLGSKINKNDCQRKICESPATISSVTSSPSNSSRWSPSTTISSSTVAPWSVASTKSLAVSSPSPEDGTPIREDSPPTTRIHSEESLNDFDDAKNPSLLRLGRHSRKRKRRRKSDCEGNERRRRRKKRKNHDDDDDDGVIERWESQMISTDIVNDNYEDSNGLPDDGIEGLEDRLMIIRQPQEARKRGLKTKEKSERTIVRSPKNWEMIINRTGFINSRSIEESERRNDDQCRIKIVGNRHFDSIDLEKAKNDQHLQPRVLLEQLQIGKSPDNRGNLMTPAYEDDIEEEEEEILDPNNTKLVKIHSNGRQDDSVTNDTLVDKTEICDILSMLDSTGSPVLATDTPIAHLPNIQDSTKTNCYDNQHTNNQKTRQECIIDEKKNHERLLQKSLTKKSVKIPVLPIGTEIVHTKNDQTCFIGRSGRNETDVKSNQSIETSVERKSNRRDNPSERIETDLANSSDILEALRSTPGLSISVTTRNSSSEITDNIQSSRNQTKRNSTGLSLEKLLCPSPQQKQAPSSSSSNSEIPEDRRNQITLQAILASPVRSALPTDKMSGLAAVVNRLANRRNESRLHSQNEPKLRNSEKEDAKNLGRKDCKDNGIEPAKQLRDLVEKSGNVIPDPLLVPRERLPALAASPAVEIPKLLASRPELRLPEALTRPDLLKDPDLLVISLAHLQHVLDHGDAPVSDYTYKPPHPLGMPIADGDDEVDEEDELDDEEEDDDDDEEDDEDEDLDVPEQSLNLPRNQSLKGIRPLQPPPHPTAAPGSAPPTGDIVRKTQREPPELISCKPINSLMPIDLSRNCVRTFIPNRNNQTSSVTSASKRHQEFTPSQLPPPPLLRVRTSGLLKQETDNGTSNEISSNCGHDDSHLWHPLFGSQKIQRQQQAHDQQQQQQNQQQKHRTPWHRTTVAS